MSHRHAAARASRAVAHAAHKSTSAPAGLSGALTQPGSTSGGRDHQQSAKKAQARRDEHPDVAFARKLVQATLHGHSPLWHYRGWRAPGRLTSKNPYLNPTYYLNRKLIEGEIPNNAPRKFVRQQKALARVKRFTREFSSSARSSAYRKDEGQDLDDASFEDAADDADGPPSLSLGAAKRTLQPGDWVQVRIFGHSSGAIYLENDRIKTVRPTRRAIVHGFDNTLHSVRLDDILFTIPGVVPQATAREAAKILALSPPAYIENLAASGHPGSTAAGGGSSAPTSELIVDEKSLWDMYGVEYDTPTWRAAFQAKSACVAALRDMKIKQERAKAELATKGPRGLYKHFVTRGREQIATLDAYRVLFPSVTIVDGAPRLPTIGVDSRHHLLALHDILLEDPEHFVLHSFGTLVNSEFRIRPEAELHRLREVRDWIRSSSQNIVTFEKNASFVQDKIAEASGNADGSSTTALHQSWSEDDSKIIGFLQDSLDMRRNIQKNPFAASAAILLRNMTRHEAVESSGACQDNEQADIFSPSLQLRQATIDFLKSIGVYSDSENLVLRDRQLDLAGRIKAQAAYINHSSKAPSQNIDGLDSVRHDFGQLPVYVIDDPGASELDDGISIEQVSGSNDTYWVHVHIADPTSSLSPGDPLVQHIRKSRSALYLSEFVSPMIPDTVMNSYKWSLGALDEHRVLSFSAKFDASGEIIERKVRPGIVRNVLPTTYATVNKLLGQDNAEQSSQKDEAYSLAWPTHSIVTNTGQERPISTLPPNASSDLGMLLKLSRCLLQSRVRSGHVSWNNTSQALGIGLKPRPFYGSFSQTEASRAFGRPHLSLPLPSTEVRLVAQSESISGKLVAEFMVMAGRIAASHLKEHNIAATFRAQDTPVAPSDEDLQQLRAIRDQATGEIDSEETSRRGIAFSPAYFSSRPADHWPMGIRGSDGGYAQATSPLRRFNDMIVHLQLKSTLHGGATRSPPFSVQDIEDHIKACAPYDRLFKRIEQRSRAFWKLFLVSKKIEEARRDPSADPRAAELLLNGLTAKVHSSRRDYASLQTLVTASIPELGGLQATLIVDPRHEGLDDGTRLKVDIVSIILDDFSRMFVRLKL